MLGPGTASSNFCAGTAENIFPKPPSLAESTLEESQDDVATDTVEIAEPASGREETQALPEIAAPGPPKIPRRTKEQTPKRGSPKSASTRVHKDGRIEIPDVDLDFNVLANDLAKSINDRDAGDDEI